MSDIAPPPAAPANEISRQASLNSTLGGAKAISDRFKAFQAAESAKAAPDAASEAAPEPAVPTLTAPETRSQSVQETQKQASGILPPEKAPAEVKTPPSQSTETNPNPPKVGKDNMTKEERADFLKYKAEAARVTELEQKVKDYEATRAEKEELAKRYAEIEERAKVLEAKATAFDVRNSPHFQETIEKPMLILSKGMDELIQKNSLKAQEVYDAIWAQDEIEGNIKLAEFLGGMDGFTADKFKRMTNDMRDLSRRAQELSARAPEAWSAIQAEEKKKAELNATKAKETYRLANEAVFHGDGQHQGMKDRFTFLKDTPEGEQVLKEAMAVDFDALDAGSKAYYAQAGLAALHFNNVIKSKDAEIASLKAALQKDNRVPNPSDGHRPTPQSEAAVTEDKLKGMSTGQRLAYFLQNGG
jgi:hypothetical protein